MTATSDRDFADLIDRVLDGDKDAAQELHEVYRPHILRAVRKRLHPKVRSKFDSLDFVQDVWASFFRGLPEQDLFKTPEQLVAFLTTVARNKVAEAARTRLQRQKYNVAREAPHFDATDREMAEVPADQPTPSEVMMGQEAWDRLLARQPLVYRRILVLFREGRPTEKIAQDLALSPRTVRRALLRALGEVES